MTRITATDRVTITARDLTPEGYLLAPARIARTGIQVYRAWEMGMTGDAPVRVYRPPEEVFSADSLASWAGRPVTSDHPAVLVDATNWRKHAVGMVNGPAVEASDHAVAPLLITDAAAVARAQDAELSCGYTCDVDPTPGTTPDGEAYDAVQTKIRGNHVALVDRARCGPTCRIGDSAAGSLPCTCQLERTGAMTTRTITVDGISIEVTDQGAQVIERLTAQLTDARAAANTAAQAHAGAIAARDGQIAALQSQIVDAAALDRMIADRSAVIDAARKMVGDGLVTDGSSIADIRAQAVAVKLGADVVAGKDAAYIAAAFDTLRHVSATPSGPDPVRGAIASRVPAADAFAARDAALRERDEYLSNAWRGTTAA